MKIARTKIAQSISDHTLIKGSSAKYSRELAAYLLAENRVDELDSLMRDVQDCWAKAGYVEVIASSAFALTEEVKSHIKSQIRSLYPEARQVVVTEARDPAVIGGVRLELAGQQLDLSAQAKLNKFKQLTSAGKDL